MRNFDVEKHAGSAKRSVMIKAGVETVWKKLSEITKLGWLEEQKSTRFFKITESNRNLAIN